MSNKNFDGEIIETNDFTEDDFDSFLDYLEDIEDLDLEDEEDDYDDNDEYCIDVKEYKPMVSSKNNFNNKQITQKNYDNANNLSFSINDDYGSNLSIGNNGINCNINLNTLGNLFGDINDSITRRRYRKMKEKARIEKMKKKYNK
jgi:hypothetical protein